MGTPHGDEEPEELPDELAGLAARMDDAARDLHQQDTWTETLDVIVEHALRAIPAAEHAGITVTRGEGFATLAASDPLPEKVDQEQYSLGEGPCVDAAVRESVFRGEDLTRDARWPRFAPRAADLGVRSMLAVPLFEEERRSGALNLYAATPGAFEEGDESAAVIYAAQASLALARAHDHESAQQMHEALERNRTIGMAIGILMGSRGITSEQALVLLRDSSQRRNVRLSELAETVAYTGELPSRSADGTRRSDTTT